MTWTRSGRFLRASTTSTASSILRSEEHTSELQSRSDLVCRLLLEKKKKNDNNNMPQTYTHHDEQDIIERTTADSERVQTAKVDHVSVYLVRIAAVPLLTRDHHVHIASRVV